MPRELLDHPVYEVHRELGRGGMGIVYLALHKEMGRLEALKVMQAASGHQARERFRREVQLVGKLLHPNIVTAYGAFPAGSALVLAMEFVDGQSLARFISRHGPLPHTQACEIARQVARGLERAHEYGLVHRDIKPDNIMITTRGEVKILDFGVARAVSEESQPGLTTTGTTMGTPAYMAPEQARNARKADTRADLYSLGCTLFCMLTGQPPFIADSYPELILSHQLDAPPRLSDFRPDAPPPCKACFPDYWPRSPTRGRPHRARWPPSSASLPPLLNLVGGPGTRPNWSTPPSPAPPLPPLPSCSPSHPNRPAGPPPCRPPSSTPSG